MSPCKPIIRHINGRTPDFAPQLKHHRCLTDTRTAIARGSAVSIALAQQICTPLDLGQERVAVPPAIVRTHGDGPTYSS